MMAHIFISDTKHLRSVLNQSKDQLHVSAEKWHRYTLWRPDPKSQWNGIWESFLLKELYFVWQILHRAPTANEWRFRNRPNTSRRKQCNHYRPRVVEDINHPL